MGLRISFGPGGPASYSWALAIGLATYTLLLATTACFLIRVGHLWDDLRSLLLLIVMMFLAMSFDDTMAADGRSLGYLVGFVFGVVVSEAVLRVIQLRLAGWYRAAYYAILALMVIGALFDDWLGQLARHRVNRCAGDRCGRRGSHTGDRPRLAGQARALVPAVRHGRDRCLWALGPRSPLPGDRRREPGFVDRLFWSVELPAASTTSDWSRPDRLRSFVVPDRGSDQIYKGRAVAAIGRHNHKVVQATRSHS